MEPTDLPPFDPPAWEDDPIAPTAAPEERKAWMQRWNQRACIPADVAAVMVRVEAFDRLQAETDAREAAIRNRSLWAKARDAVKEHGRDVLAGVTFYAVLYIGLMSVGTTGMDAETGSPYRVLDLLDRMFLFGCLAVLASCKVAGEPYPLICRFRINSRGRDASRVL